MLIGFSFQSFLLDCFRYFGVRLYVVSWFSVTQVFKRIMHHILSYFSPLIPRLYGALQVYLIFHYY